MTTLIVGASNKKDRYSNKAMKKLVENGHKIILMHPKLKKIEGKKVYNSISEIKADVHTITLYVNKTVSNKMDSQILELNPKRIIFNPGAENDSLKEKAETLGIKTVYGCTLVMLSTGQF